MVTKKTTAPSTASRTAADWENAALTAIAENGLGAVAIPDLARSLGVTKGSFYWHFRGIQELIAAALRRWETLDREGLDEVRGIANARNRLAALFVQAMEKRDAHALYIALAPSTDEEVASAIRRISDRRLRFLIDAYQELGADRAGAREQALLAYAAYLGALALRQQGLPGLKSEKDVAAYVEHAVKTLIPR